MQYEIWSVSNGGTKIMYDDYDYDPCENCSMDCDAWEMPKTQGFERHGRPRVVRV